MNIHNFLIYWSDHNDMIIKVLIALSLFIIIFLAFRIFFGTDASAAGAGVTNLDTAQLEKTLQKILEAQGKTPVFAVPKEGATASGSGEVFKMAGGAGATASTGAPGASAEVAALKKDLAEKEKLLAIARQQQSVQVDAGTGAAGPSAGALGRADDSIAKLEAKIKNLEARLAEYEIISEDIADLSFYKEENIRLQNELTQKGGGSAVPAAAPATSAPPAAAPTSAPVMAAPAEATPVTVVVPVAPAAVATGSVQSPAPVIEVTPSDSDLMKEFAKAVEEQKGAVGEAIPNKGSAENTQLMNQFETFVKKT